MRSKEKEYFDSIANVFDWRFNVYAKHTGRLRVQRRSDLFSRFCQLRPGIKALEIGCGTGEYSRSFLKQGCDLFCTDISYNMLIKAFQKSSGIRSLRHLVCDSENIPFKNSICDVVLGNSILHHLDVAKAASEVFRVLKEGGRFAFSEPNMLNPYVFLQKNIKFLKKISGDSPEETAFLRPYIKRVFFNAGFKEVNVTPFDFLFPHIPSFLANMVNRLGKGLEKIVFLKEISGSLLITGVK